MTTSRIWAVGFLLLAVVAGVALLLQRQAQGVLREQLALLRTDQQQLVALRAENARLKAQQPSETELASLRADDAAAMRLRNELNQLRARIAAEEAAMAR